MSPIANFVFGILLILITIFIWQYFRLHTKVIIPLIKKSNGRYKLSLSRWNLTSLIVKITDNEKNRNFYLDFRSSELGESYYLSSCEFVRNNLSFNLVNNFKRRGILWTRITAEKEYKKDFGDLILYSNDAYFGEKITENDLQPFSEFIKTYDISTILDKKKNQPVTFAYRGIRKKLSPEIFEQMSNITICFEKKVENYKIT